jgi:hypothetical protein
MPVFLPKDVMGDIEKLPAHDQWHRMFKEAGSVMGAPFKKMQKGTSGFIIVVWKDDKPKNYYSEMMPAVSPFADLDSETEPEYPVIYRSLKGLMRRVDILRAEWPEEEIGIAFWVHPEANLPPQRLALLISTASQFPGSVRH